MQQHPPSASSLSPAPPQDFGCALGTLLRAYLGQVTHVVSDLPGGTRAYQVMAIAASRACHNQAAIAERLGLDRTIMTYLVDGLEAQELVKRTPDPVDRRARQVTLTAKGSALFTELAGHVSHIERHLLSGLAGPDAEQLRTLVVQAATFIEAAGKAGHACQTLESANVSTNYMYPERQQSPGE